MELIHIVDTILNVLQFKWTMQKETKNTYRKRNIKNIHFKNSKKNIKN